jgi:hypothetical protein
MYKVMGNKSSRTTKSTPPPPSAPLSLHVHDIERRLAEHVWDYLRPRIEIGVFEAQEVKALPQLDDNSAVCKETQKAVIELLNSCQLKDTGLRVTLLYSIFKNDAKKYWIVAWVVERGTLPPPSYTDSKQPHTSHVTCGAGLLHDTTIIDKASEGDHPMYAVCD